MGGGLSLSQPRILGRSRGVIPLDFQSQFKNYRDARDLQLADIAGLEFKRGDYPLAWQCGKELHQKTWRAHQRAALFLPSMSL
jgi:hypothetical protein